MMYMYMCVPLCVYVHVCSSLCICSNITLVGPAFLASNITLVGPAFLASNITLVGPAFLASNITLVGPAFLASNITLVGPTFFLCDRFPDPHHFHANWQKTGFSWLVGCLENKWLVIDHLHNSHVRQHESTLLIQPSCSPLIRLISNITLHETNMLPTAAAVFNMVEWSLVCVWLWSGKQHDICQHDNMSHMLCHVQCDVPSSPLAYLAQNSDNDNSPAR